MGDMKWLDAMTVDGLKFRKGDNGCQVFYAAKANGILWQAIQNHVTEPALPGMEPEGELSPWQHKRYWYALAERSGVLLLLTGRTQNLNGKVEKDVLADRVPPGWTDPPTTLLEGIAELVRKKLDPWQIERA